MEILGSWIEVVPAVDDVIGGEGHTAEKVESEVSTRLKFPIARDEDEGDLDPSLTGSDLSHIWARRWCILTAIRI